jgi:histone acetyltransferase (RNA polymerase elongator complex component)
VTKMNKNHYIIPIFIPMLGCPNMCVFCNQKKITGQIHIPNKDEVSTKIEQYLLTILSDRMVNIEVAFYGGSFTAVDKEIQKELLSTAFKFILDGKITSIRVSTRPDAITDEIMSLLSAYGVDTVELGVQSMDDIVLFKAGRGHTGRDVLRATALIKTWGLNLGFQIMIGLPGDSTETDIFTADELIALKPDMVRIYPCLVLRNTELEELYIRGEYTPLTLEQAVERSKKLLLKFEKAAVNVIRIGLQPSEQISFDGEVIAGPYHPAMRELVESAIARDQVESLIQKTGGQVNGGTIQLSVNERDVSVVRGHNGSNVEFFKGNYNTENYVTQIDNTLPRGTIRLDSLGDSTYNIISTRQELMA